MSLSFKDEVNLDKVGSINSETTEDHRTGSSFGAYFNIVCTVAGTGTLALPGAVGKSGWISLVFFCITACVSIFTGKMLVECLYYKPDQRLKEFPDIGEAAFGKFGRYFTKVFHYSISLSSAIIYILLTGSNIFDMLERYNNGITYVSKEIWILLAGIIVAIPFSLLKTLKEVAWLAALGAISTLIVVFVVVVQGALDYSDMPVKPVTSFVNLESIPITLSTIAFSYGGTVVYPHVEASMRHPQNWNRVLFFAIFSITLMYLLVGSTGYFYYGEGVMSPIMQSLSNGAGSIVAYASITVHVLLASPIYLCSFSLEQENLLKIDRKFMSSTKEFLCRVSLRLFISAVVTGVAMVIPHFTQLANVIGAISNSLIVFLLPVVFHLRLFGWRGRSIVNYSACAFIGCLGIFGLIFSTKSAMQDLIDVMSGKAVKSGH